MLIDNIAVVISLVIYRMVYDVTHVSLGSG